MTHRVSIQLRQTPSNPNPNKYERFTHLSGFIKEQRADASREYVRVYSERGCSTLKVMIPKDNVGFILIEESWTDTEITKKRKE